MTASLDSATPIIIGAGMRTHHAARPEDVRAPQELMAEAARLALADAGNDIASAIEDVAVIRTFADSAPQFASPFGGAAHYPDALARRLGIRPHAAFYPQLGGDTPQATLALLADRLKQGKARAALLVAGEAMAGAHLAAKAGLELDWREEAGPDAPPLVEPGALRPGMTPQELAHGIAEPAHVYPLFESAYAQRHGRAMPAQRERIGALFAGFSAVATSHPHAWDRTVYTADALITPTPDNRLIAWPYTKRLCAQMYVDQAAAVVLTTVGEARKLGIAPDRWIFPWASVEIAEKWTLAERPDLASAPAVRMAGSALLSACGTAMDDIAFIDLYSCFPSAVALGAEALGLALDTPKRLTLTGGLPYFGGPGNGYSLFAIATLVMRLRAAREAATGLIWANGWYLTKHALGLYGNRPSAHGWRHLPNDDLQARIEAMVSPAWADRPEGRGVVEAATVIHDRTGQPVQGLLYGRLGQDGRGARFIAILPREDEDGIAALLGPRPVGLPVVVHSEQGRNIARIAL